MKPPLIIKQMYVLYQKTLILLLKIYQTQLIHICTSEIQYPFRNLYLPTQIQMNIVYRKPVLNASFQDFLFINKNNHQICFEKDEKKK